MAGVQDVETNLQLLVGIRKGAAASENSLAVPRLPLTQ